MATVSYVLNNGPRSVRPGTRDRVLEAVERLDYTPNAVARGLVRRRTDTIGVLAGTGIFTTLSNPYTSAVLEGVVYAAGIRGFNTMLFTAGSGGAQVPRERLRDRRVDGLLFVAPVRESVAVTQIRDLRVPVVLISALSADPNLSAVDIDNACGARLATEHLLDLGHRHIAHIHGQPEQASALARRAAFLATMRSAGCDVPQEYIVASDYDGLDYAGIEHLLRRPNRPSAIFAANDMIALRVLEVARDQGLRIPHDLSLVGFDDIGAAALTAPPLTTIRQPLTTLGKQATDILISQIQGEVVEPVRVIASPELIVRGTTARPG